MAVAALGARVAACSTGPSGRAGPTTVAPGTITVDGWKPPQMDGPPAAAYIGAVAAYLQSFVRAGLDLNRRPAGSLAPLTSASINTAYTQLTSFVHSRCHYVIGAGAPSA